jgi:hypothetical protein
MILPFIPPTYGQAKIKNERSGLEVLLPAEAAARHHGRAMQC